MSRRRMCAYPPDATEHYTDPAVVERYAADRAKGLTEREERAVERYFDPGTRVLDVGCGGGRTTAALDDCGFDVIGLDVSAPMIRAARRGSDEASYLVGDATALPFRAASFDHALFSYNGIDELAPVAARRDAIREVYRVLRPGGHFLFSCRNLRTHYVAYPPTPRAFASVVRFWLMNARAGLLDSPYKLEPSVDRETLIHYTTPPAQRRQLRECGFELVDVIGRGGVGARLFGFSLYYVARKPLGTADC